MKLQFITLASSAMLGLSAAASAAPVSIVSSYTRSCVQGSCSNDSSLLYGTRTTSEASGGSSSTTTSTWLDTGTGTLFDFDFDHSRSGAHFAHAQSLNYFLQFTVGADDITYAISGKYSATDVGAPGTVYSYVYLVDSFLGTTQYVDFKYSTQTVNESFTLGAALDGDTENISDGMLTGTLRAGQTYQFYFDNYISVNGGTDATSATGCVTLSLGGATGAGSCGAAVAVPDFGLSTGGLLTIALGALATLRRWR